MTRLRLASAVMGVAAGLAVLHAVRTPVSAQSAPAAPGPIPEFEKSFLEDPKNIAAGQEIWSDQCTHCHGRNAYPGKAPKLQPSRYTPDFVYDRVTWGFRKMPAWEDSYSETERKQIVSYVLSNSFSP